MRRQGPSETALKVFVLTIHGMLAAYRVRKSIRGRHRDGYAFSFEKRRSACHLVLFDEESRFFWTHSARHIEIFRVREMGSRMPYEGGLLVEPEVSRS